MSGSLTHSPAEVVRQLLVDLSLGTLPSAGGSWPICATQELDSPDNAMTVYDTSGRLDGRTMTDGEQQEHYGFQVRVRSATHEAGHAKANAIAVALDQSVLLEVVTVETSVYLVQAVSRTTNVLPIGKETGLSKRSLFTINAVVSLRQTT